VTPLLGALGDIAALTAALVDLDSVSGTEGPIADAVHAVLLGVPELHVSRRGNVVWAWTELGRTERVLLAGHLDTVPAAGNAGARVVAGPDGPEVGGLGSVDMKGGVAIALQLAATVPPEQLTRDLTVVFYDCEEVQAARNGLGHLAAAEPGALAADLAVLLEPTGGVLEGGCQGSLHVRVATAGARAHTARAWMGHNAIHAVAPVLDRLAAYVPSRPVVDGLEYREGLQAVAISGGVAGNVVPDRCALTVNFRYAPDRDSAGAVAHVRDVFAGFDVEVLDDAGAARPGLDRPAVAALAAAVGGRPRAKYGWTDVARFAALGIAAVNYGPGDPSRAHTAGESVPVSQLLAVGNVLGTYLRADTSRASIVAPSHEHLPGHEQPGHRRTDPAGPRSKTR
jgi:succinyl-diaminopimelate desuccinylase